MSKLKITGKNQAEINCPTRSQRLLGNPPPLAPSLEISQAERRRDRIEKIKQEERPEGNREESSLIHVKNPSLTSELNRNQVAIIIPEEQDSDPYPEFLEYDSEPEISATLLAKHFEFW